MILDRFSSGVPLRGMKVAAVWRIRCHSHPRPMLRGSKISNEGGAQVRGERAARVRRRGLV
jgi:hypothetical protein